MLDIEGIRLTEEDRSLLTSPEVGGLILFSRNYHDRDQLRLLIESVRSLRSDLLIAVDQEGGRVQRFRNGFESLPSIQKIANLARSIPSDAEDICFSLAWLMATDVLCADIDISFAPVLDLDRDQCQVISDRSFSEDPDEAIKMAAAYISGMQEAGMASTAKHFPGHGAVRGDSHLELPIDSRSFEEVSAKDMLPFKKLVNQYNAVMPGHLLYPNIDELPVGFSPFWLQQILRSELNFDGVIFSDDLTMEGAAASGSYTERAKLALNAGCDMLLVCNNPEGAREVLHFLQDSSIVKDFNKPNPRLAQMKARKQWDQNLVRQSPIYNRAKSYLKKIEENNHV